MNITNPARVPKGEKQLSVSYKAPGSLDLFLQHLADVVIITDPDFTIKAFNHAAETFFGQPASHFIGSPFRQKISFDFKSTSRDVFLQTLFKTGMWNGEVIFTHTNNQEFIFYSNVSLLYDENGAASSIVIVSHNITEEEKQKRKLAFAENKYRIVIDTLTEGLVLINTDASIEAANPKACEILGCTEAQLQSIGVGSSVWNAIYPDGKPFPPENFPAAITLRTGSETRDMIMGIHKPDATIAWVSVNTRPIYKDGSTAPDGVISSFKDITNEKNTAEKLKESELFFERFMSNSASLGWIYDEHGNFVYGNPLFIRRVGFEAASIGKHITDISSADVANRILSMNKRVMETGESFISEDELTMPDGSTRYFLANYFAIPGKSQMLIGGQAIDITERKQAEAEIAQMHERFGYVVNASSDAIWDLDLRTNEIYRSDAFTKISGYSREEIQSNLFWWCDKIHPEDRERVNKKIEEQLQNCVPHWEDEYRFLHADGTYRYIYDKGFAIYENNVPVRQIGSMQDITDRKKLEAQLLFEQVQKQKVVNQATINAQEEERNRISAELHDNVNQLLMSARLHIDVAKNNAENQKKMLDKATDYLLHAVEEIRALSKKMNSKIVTSVGLLESIADIVSNMRDLYNISMQTDIDISVIDILSPEQQLMVFRIVQEQTANIIKHANASAGRILLKLHNGDVQLHITDNGKGFDQENQKLKGIGHINIFNRVDAYNGKATLETAPGKGCGLFISFPVS